MLRTVDPRLPPEVLFVLWVMGHGSEVAVVSAEHVVERGRKRSPHSGVLRMDEFNVPGAARAVLSALALDTTFVNHPVSCMKSDRATPLSVEHRIVQDEIDAALGFSCPMSDIGASEFQQRVESSYAVIVAGSERPRGGFILRKGLDVTPDTVLTAGAQR